MMLFNLIVPLAIKSDNKLLRMIFTEFSEYIGDNVELIFEYSDRAIFKESKGQPTSFDLAIISDSNRPILFESKLVETNFGGCSVIENGDCDGLNPSNKITDCYLHNIGRTYWELMIKYNADVSYKHDKTCPLAIYYQFFREVLLAKEKNGIFCLIYDERNPAFVRENGRGLYNILRNSLPDYLKEITYKITIQEIVKRMKDEKLNWIDEFSMKYGM